MPIIIAGVAGSIGIPFRLHAGFVASPSLPEDAASTGGKIFDDKQVIRAWWAPAYLDTSDVHLHLA